MRLFRSIAVSLALLAAGFNAFAQNRELTGVVLDATDFPLIGVAVIVDGTTNGVMTAEDGSFALTVPAAEVVLNVSSLGYETKLVTVPATQDKITIYLSEDNMLIEETVVVGYGTQKKVNLTGAIGVVESKELENRTSHNLTGMLQGAVPGLNISTSSGNPGSTGSINIRGVGSINGGNPLVMIDGAEGDISRVNAADVESISVIKDAAAAAVYGARAAFGVILITTKKGNESSGKSTVRYSGRVGWESPTTSTDYETSGYWSVYAANLFYAAEGAQYLPYNDYDMQQLLLRVNDKTEHPDRPWVVVENHNGKDRYKYYANTDWYHELFRDDHPVTQHQISFSGGNKDVKYYLSGAFDRQTGIFKQNPDVFKKYNLRSKIDFNINKYAKLSNNTSFYSSNYDYIGTGDVQNAIAYSNRHALACFPLKNPDGTWIGETTFHTYRIANGRHIIYGNDNNINSEKKTDFSNTTELTITPVKQFKLIANFTYRFHQNRDTNRSTNMAYSMTPDGALTYYDKIGGAGENSLTEAFQTSNYIAANVFGTYEDTFKDAHHLTMMAGFNYETRHRKDVMAKGYHLLSDELSDLDLVGTDPNESNATFGQRMTDVSGGQTEYALAGFFARLNYDYKGKYLLELAGRYDGSSRFAPGSRWGFFPSGSIGWRISEEDFFASAKNVVNNLKVRASLGSLGNQNVDNYAYMRLVNLTKFKSFYFGDTTTSAPYSNLSAPNASDLTWETSYQYNFGVDLGMFEDRLSFTGEMYMRNTKGMLTQSITLPSVYGASEPKTNSADLRTLGYELSLSWRDQFDLGGRPFGYNVRATLSDYSTTITKFDNPDRTFAKDYYEGMKLGEIWGFEVDGLFATDAEAKAYEEAVNYYTYFSKTRLVGGLLAGDLKYVDLDGDGKITIGEDTVDNPGDRKILGNSLASLQYGLTFGFDYAGFDFSMFLQGTGNHYWYPSNTFSPFWGNYSFGYSTYLPKNFLDDVWAEDNPDAYFPRPRVKSAYTAKSLLSTVNSRYIQNKRYLRVKNLTVGYTLPKNISEKVGLDKLRVYFAGENLHYWSPLKEHTRYVDPEAAYNRSNADYDSGFYPWQKSFIFGVDITF